MAFVPPQTRRGKLGSDLGWRVAWEALLPAARTALTAAGLGDPIAWAHLLDDTPDEEVDVELLATVEALAQPHNPTLRWGELLVPLHGLLTASTKPAMILFLAGKVYLEAGMPQRYSETQLPPASSTLSASRTFVLG